MRSLGRPEVLNSAIIAGLCTALVCWPRIATAPHLRYPVWYLEAVVLLGGIVLWGFVLAWHSQYTQRPVFTLKVSMGPLALATIAGLAAALKCRSRTGRALIQHVCRRPAGSSAERRVAGRSSSPDCGGRAGNDYASHRPGRGQSSESRTLAGFVAIYRARETQRTGPASGFQRRRSRGVQLRA